MDFFKYLFDWKVLVVVIIAVLFWFFPKQDGSFKTLVEEEKKPLFLSICDPELASYPNATVTAVPDACTEKLCPDDPCCNTCTVVWEIEKTHFRLNANKDMPTCDANECGLINCEQSEFKVLELREKICKKQL